MERIWTPAQKAAMGTLGRTLLISAAAGSGKTATLTERIIRRLTDPVAPAELSRLLIVTFTRAAAAELRERIGAALTEAIGRDPGNRHLQNQLIGLGGAHISTIDAFCREHVKAHFAELGLPAPSTGVSLADLLRRPAVSYEALAVLDPDRPVLTGAEALSVEVQVKYQGYIARQLAEVARHERLESKMLSPDLDYSAITGLRIEAAQKLNAQKPLTVGQASRISGVSPADISVLLIYLGLH